MLNYRFNLYHRTSVEMVAQTVAGETAMKMQQEK